MRNWNEVAGFIWNVADLLRGDYKPSEYGKVMLPLVVLRRLDCVLEPTKAEVLATYERLKDQAPNLEPFLRKAAGQQFYNTSKLSFGSLLNDPDNLEGNLRAYMGAFSPGSAEVLDKFGFDEQISRLHRAKLLYKVVAKFADIDLHPNAIDNMHMGYLFEELIRRFSEQPMKLRANTSRHAR